MRLLLLLSAVAVLLTPQVGRAQPAPVVLELFTSQGCSSCPPADALLAELAEPEGVIALALHVDYWDYLGWEDGFASPAHTERQRAYAKAARSRTIFTPQMIVQGEERLKGHDAEQHPRADRGAPDAPGAASARRSSREGDALAIRIAPLAGGRRAGGRPCGALHARREEVSIDGGENAGQDDHLHQHRHRLGDDRALGRRGRRSTCRLRRGLGGRSGGGDRADDRRWGRC